MKGQILALIIFCLQFYITGHNYLHHATVKTDQLEINENDNRFPDLDNIDLDNIDVDKLDKDELEKLEKMDKGELEKLDKLHKDMESCQSDEECGYPWKMCYAVDLTIATIKTCNITWWMVLIAVLAGLVVLITIISCIVVCCCKMCCCK